MRKAFAIASVAVVVSACGTVLGLRDIDEASSDDAGTTDAGVTDTAVADAPSVPPDGGEASVVRGFCAAYPAALLCDDFEGPSFASGWRKVFEGGGMSLKPRPDATPDNARANVAGFAPIPDVGKAALAFDGLPGGRRALRFSLWVPEDNYPSGLVVAGLADGTGQGVRVELLTEGATVRLAARDSRGGSPAPLGVVAYRQWNCVEIEVDGAGTLRAWLNRTLSVGSTTTATASSIATAEIGMTWTFGGNSNASNNMTYDDVVIGTAAVGCP